MGMLIDGEWVEKSIINSDKKGSYDRLPRTFRGYVSSKSDTFKVESNRYHLYVSYACPWATRTLIYRKLKKLENHITVDFVHPDMLDKGWKFNDSFPGASKDSLFNKTYLHEVYQKADPKVTTSVTVPVLWDKKNETIVNNESSEIIRMFDHEFSDLTGCKTNYYPDDKKEKIDKINEVIYKGINNGVYRVGFSKTQEAYDNAITLLFKTLNEMDERLSSNKFLLGDEITEADLRLIPTLLRFDIVYVTHFKCNLKRIQDYSNLFRYTKDLYALKEIKESTNFEHIKRHYYYSHIDINPYRIVPQGPETYI